MTRKNAKSSKRNVKNKGFKREPFEPVKLKIKEAKAFVYSKQLELSVAIRKKNHKLATKIARSITRSHAGRVVAVHRVITNKGYRTKGFRDKRPTTNKEYMKIVKDLWKVIKHNNVYKASPLKRTYIKKPKGGLRPISVPTIFDRCLQALFKLPMDVYMEEQADKFSFGFRPYRSPGWAAAACWFMMHNPSKFGPPKYVVEIDIRKCFDTIDHLWLLNNIPFIPRTILYQWLKCGFVEAKNKYPHIYDTEGIPQGGVISPTLTNMTLDGMEEAVNTHLTQTFPKQRQSWARTIRYVDDAVIFTYSRKAAYQAIEAIKKFLATRGLTINPEKTKITKWTIEDYEFVGFNFHSRIVNKKRRIYYNIPKYKITNIFHRLRIKLKNTYSLTDSFLITNSILRGFCRFYAVGHTKKQLCSIHWQLFKIFNNQLKKIYQAQPSRIKNILPNIKKSVRKRKATILRIIRQYHFTRKREFSTYLGKRRYYRWFSLPKNKKARRGLKLVQPANIPIKYATFITGKSAYHKDDIPAIAKKAMSYKDQFVKKVLKKTNGICPICAQNLLANPANPFQLHHILPYAMGGKLTLTNMVALCKECHSEVTRAVASKNVLQCLELEQFGVLDSLAVSQILGNSK